MDYSCAFISSICSTYCYFFFFCNAYEDFLLLHLTSVNSLTKTMSRSCMQNSDISNFEVVSYLDHNENDNHADYASSYINVCMNVCYLNSTPLMAPFTSLVITISREIKKESR